jgi:hypothetical protein
MISGSCLCGGIQFEIHGDLPGIGQCHCSLCRKVSGVGSTATINIAAEQLVWRSGQDLVAEFQRPSGYGTSFCRVCGSPAPDANRTQTRYGVPIGLLAAVPTAIAEHTYVASKASWDVIGDDAPQYAQAGPPLPEGQLALPAGTRRDGLITSA